MIVEGTLHEYHEQGWEAHFELHLCETGKSGWEGAIVLAPGDVLTVWDSANAVIFDGPLPVWTERTIWVFWTVKPVLPAGFFEWFCTHHHRARLVRASE